HPDRARLGELGHEIVERARRRCALARKLADRLGILVENDAAVAVPHEPAHDVAAHAAEADHSQLHRDAPYNEGQPSALRAARSISARPAAPSPAICARNTRRPRSASTRKSPRACAAWIMTNVALRPGTGRSCPGSAVICRNTPVLGPPL